jgi:hypothetical protein
VKDHPFPYFLNIQSNQKNENAYCYLKMTPIRAGLLKCWQGEKCQRTNVLYRTGKEEDLKRSINIPRLTKSLSTL